MSAEFGVGYLLLRLRRQVIIDRKLRPAKPQSKKGSQQDGLPIRAMNHGPNLTESNASGNPGNPFLSPEITVLCAVSNSTLVFPH